MVITIDMVKGKVEDSLLGTGVSAIYDFEGGGRQYYKTKYGLQDYHLDFLYELDALFKLKDASVLESGGSNMPYEIVVDFFKVKKWVSLDIPWWNKKYDPHKDHPVPQISHKELTAAYFTDAGTYKYMIVNGITDDINELFYDKFDIIVSTCCFEHIMNLPLTFEKMYCCLKRGGVGYSSFSPIYSAYHGHHAWLKDDIGIKLNDLKCFPPHGHLFMSKMEIYKLLKKYFPNSKNCDRDSEILKYGQDINHHFYEDYEFFLENSPFEEYIIRPLYETFVPEKIMKILSDMYPSYSKFNYGGIKMLFIKK